MVGVDGVGQGSNFYLVDNLFNTEISIAAAKRKNVSKEKNVGGIAGAHSVDKSLPRTVRHFEFARAIVKERLADSTSPLRYIGFAKLENGASKAGEVTKAMRSQVWEHWDNSSHAPPKIRPTQGGDTESRAPPDLQVLAWQSSRPIWPEFLNTKFAAGSEEQSALEKKHTEFLQKFPESGSTPQTLSETPPRVGGLCDFTINDGKMPLNWRQQISLPAVKEDDFTVARLRFQGQMCSQ